MAKKTDLQIQISPSALTFLNSLAKNNNRDWFTDHKTEFEKEKESIEDFAQALLNLLSTHDLIETPSGKKSLYRIYKDVRFSKDKTPYKTHWSGSFKRATKYRRGGYYFHIEAGNSFIAGGFWGPSPEDLKLIREDIAFDPSPLRKILADPAFINVFETLKGDQLKTSPKGFDANDEAIDLLRYKQFLLVKKFTDQEVLSNNFLEQANLAFVTMRPFFDYMSEVLSTDINGLKV